MPQLSKPGLWPRFSSPLRSTALTARLGSMNGICFGVSADGARALQEWTQRKADVVILDVLLPG